MKNLTNSTQNTTPKIYIDEVTVTGDTVAIDYTLNDEWKSATLSFNVLKQFALQSGINEFSFDYCNGEHIQVSGSHDIDTFMGEHLKDVITAFLRVYPAEDVFEVISARIEALKASLNYSIVLPTMAA